LVISVVIYFGIAGGLILSQRPGDLPPGDGLDFANLRSGTDAPLQPWTAPDGATLHFRKYGSGSDALVVLIHGSGWHSGGSYTVLAENIAQDPGITVLVPDLRGHGINADPRGDVAYIGQLDDDLAALITQQQPSGAKLVIAGHSSGGGLAIRYAGGLAEPKADHMVLIAPFVHHTAPTLRANAGGWSHVLLRRVIGLSMLNMAKVTAFNYLTAVQFRVPPAIVDQGGTDAYSFRLNTSYAPRNDWQSDVAALPQFDLIVGSQDEAFVANAFEPTLSEITDLGQYTMVPNEGHLSILFADTTAEIIRNAATN
ncbi:MAG: alpha/beta hydrolase, partial [Planktomarina sp.]